MALETEDNALRTSLSAEARQCASSCVFRGVEPDGARLLALAAGGMQEGVSVVKLPVDCNLASVSKADLHLACRALAIQQQWEIARLLTAELLQRDATDTTALELSARAQLETRDRRGAVASCHKLIALEPDNATPWKLLATIYEQRGLQLQLVEIYPRIIERAPADADNYRQRLVRALIHTGDRTRARKEFDRLKSSTTEIPGIGLTEARLLRVEGNLDAALAKSQAILREDPDYPGALKLLAQLQLSANRPAQAISLLKHAVQLAPYDEESHFTLGQAYAAARKSEKSEEHLQIHHRLKSAQITIGQLEATVSRQPDNVEILRKLADMLEVTGDFEGSNIYRKAAARAGRGG